MNYICRRYNGTDELPTGISLLSVLKISLFSSSWVEAADGTGHD